MNYKNIFIKLLQLGNITIPESMENKIELYIKHFFITKTYT